MRRLGLILAGLLLVGAAGPILVASGGTTLTDSASLAAALDDEVGSGPLLFGDAGVRVAAVTLSADGTGADCAIVGTGANSLGAAAGCTLVAGESGKIITPIFAWLLYTRVTAAYTGGGDIRVVIGPHVFTAVVTFANSFGNAASRHAFLPLAGTGLSNSTTAYEGDPMTLRAAAEITQPGTAAGTATVVVLYAIVDAD